MKFAEPLGKNPPKETDAASTFSSKASATESQKDAQYAELSFPYNETINGK